jgi:hypothetical protein
MDIVLTKRGKKVAVVIGVIAALLLITAVEDATTPDACKTDAGKQTQICKDLLYP